MKKGQGAMEYLMTYGWALIVIVIVVAALFALGILNPATYQQKRCSGFQYFTYVDQKYSEDGYILQAKNGAQVVGNISLGVDGGNLNSTIFITGNNTYNAQQGADLVLTSGFNTGKAAGNSFTTAVVIRYDVIGGIQGNTDRATCTGSIVS